MAHLDETSRERLAAGPPERLFTTILMAAIALVSNAVRPSHEEIRSHIERAQDPYFSGFLTRCMKKVYGSQGETR